MPIYGYDNRLLPSEVEDLPRLHMALEHLHLHCLEIADQCTALARRQPATRPPSAFEQRVQRKVRDSARDGGERPQLRARPLLRGRVDPSKARAIDDRLQHAVALVASPPEGQGLCAVEQLLQVRRGGGVGGAEVEAAVARVALYSS